VEGFRLFDLLHNLKQMPEKDDALAAKENGVWHKYSTQEFIDNVNHLSYAFIQLGIQKGDKIGLISNNRPEWNFVDHACSQTGAISTPLYPTISTHDLTFVIKDAGIKYFFVSNEAMYDKVKASMTGTEVKEIFSFDPTPNAKSIKELIEIGKMKFKTKKPKR